MQEIKTELARWLAAGEQIALATVVGAKGSSPRSLGSCMAVTASGQMVGSVSGGCVEGTVFEEAQTVLAGGSSRRLRYGVADETAWEVGLACGGVIDVYVEPLANVHRQLLAALAAEETVALATRLDSDEGGGKPSSWPDDKVGGVQPSGCPDDKMEGGHLLAWPDGRMEGDRSLAPGLTDLFPGPSAKLRRLAGMDVFCQVFSPPPVIVIIGAVHIAAPLVSLAQTLGFCVQIVDARRAFATRDRFPTADELIVAWPQDALSAEKLGPQHHVVILSHDPKFDLPALQIALRSRAAYVGLIGSRATQAKRQAALREAGFGDAELARIHGPVGIDLGGREPAEIALAILAEIVAARHGRIDVV